MCHGELVGLLKVSLGIDKDNAALHITLIYIYIYICLGDAFTSARAARCPWAYTCYNMIRYCICT